MRFLSILLGSAVCTLGAILLLGGPAQAGGGSDTKVKVSARAGPIDATGKQTVVVTLDVAKGWDILANPVMNEEMELMRTVVRVRSGGKPADVNIRYPAGTPRDQAGLKWMVYVDKVDIMIVVQRVAGDINPLEVEVAFRAFDGNVCVPPSRVKLIVK
jgi:hypothetical protein